MPDDDETIPLEQCTPPGSIHVTDQALDLAMRFQNSVPQGCVVTFVWFDGGRTRAGKDAPWVDTGPGVDLGAYRRSQIPERALVQAGSLRYAVLIRPEIVASHPQKTIDLDDKGNVVFR